MIATAKPRRVRAILEPIERKPREVLVGERSRIVELPIASRAPIYARPAVRIAYEPHTLGDQLRSAVSEAIERALRVLDDPRIQIAAIFAFALLVGFVAFEIATRIAEALWH